MKSSINILTGVATLERHVVDKKVGSNGRAWVSIHYTGVCGSQLFEYLGLRESKKYWPHCFGHEAIGTIEILPLDYNGKLKVGDVVLCSWIPRPNNPDSNAEVTSFQLTSLDGTNINCGAIATFGTSMSIAISKLHKIDDNFKQDFCSPLLGCAIPTAVSAAKKALDAISNLSTVENRCILINGFGGIGFLVGLYLMTASANSELPLTVYVSDVDHAKLEIAESIGLARLPMQSNVDVCIECSGAVEGINAALEKMGKVSQMLIVSHPPDGQYFKVLPHRIVSGLTITGVIAEFDEQGKFLSEIITWYSDVRDQIVSHVRLYDGLVALDEIFNSWGSGFCVRNIIRIT